jgi:hypothetical protein
MKKKFRLVLDLKVRIKEQVKVKNLEKRRHFEVLLQEFLKDEQSLLDLYKIWLLGDLQSDEYVEDIERDIQVREEKEIVKSMVKRLPDPSRQYFQEIFNRIDNSWFEELEAFFDLFSLLKLDKARFSEVKE